MGADERLHLLERRARLGELGAGIGHEVRNVLTGVLGFAQLAGDRAGDPAEVTRLCAVIERETGRALEILESFLAVGRVDRRAGSVDVNDLVLHAASLVRHTLQLGQVDVVLELDPAAPAVLGDRGALRQVLLNLAFNAAQAMSGGGVLGLATGTDGDDVVVRVTDDGPGIPEGLRGQIFDAFFTTRPGGTGLGLSVSAAIVAEHNGSLVLEPSDRGARFAVRLPRSGTGRSGLIDTVTTHGPGREGAR
jgi:signal transduction histidine kinase